MELEQDSFYLDAFLGALAYQVLEQGKFLQCNAIFNISTFEITSDKYFLIKNHIPYVFDLDK